MEITLHYQVDNEFVDETGNENDYDKIALLINEFEYKYATAKYYEIKLNVDDRELTLNSKSIGKSKKSNDVINLEIKNKMIQFYKFLNAVIKGDEIKDDDFSFEKTKKVSKKVEETE